MSDPVYIIGIDLGTTNSIVAYTDADIQKGKKPQINIFEIPQLVDAGVVEKRNILPSFIFVPGEYDVSKESLSLPWEEDSRLAVGEFARDRGEEIPQHLISSAKSWLCSTTIDRNKPILPWEGPKELSKLSPVEACDAWNHTMALEDENLKMENQDILLTVPASFDAVARELSVKAAQMAGLPHVTLLEEPQAAFYAWIEASGDKWREDVSKGDLILVCDVGGGTSDFSLIRVSEDVCDVGGGTSDFSLIRVSEEEGELVLERIAVGDHLLMG
ncbi:MAG: Hsp70 family protein, partial [Deltaproteobacteria bacterium]|nr:Hsp70 family protein [Deltaproteobacteria bacterium]